MKIPKIDEYYLKDGCYKLRPKYPKYIRAAVSSFLIAFSFIYVENSASTISSRNYEISKKEQSYIDWVSDNSNLDEDKSKNLVRKILKYSNLMDIDEKIVLAIIKVESTFNQNAISSYGAFGLMQVVPKMHIDKLKTILAESGSPNPFDIDTNLILGIRIFKECQTRQKTLEKSLQCYNGSVGLDNGYDRKVMNVYKEIS